MLLQQFSVQLAKLFLIFLRVLEPWWELLHLTPHFYNFKRAVQQPLMLIVPDVQDVYTPLESDVVVQLAECRQHLEMLQESIRTMFQNCIINGSAFGSAARSCPQLVLDPFLQEKLKAEVIYHLEKRMLTSYSSQWTKLSKPWPWNFQSTRPVLTCSSQLRHM